MELTLTNSTVFPSSTSAVSTSSGHNSAFDSIWSATGRSVSVTLQPPSPESLLGDHTLKQAISLVSLAELDSKIFDSVELKSSDINFLKLVTEKYAKKMLSAKTRK